LDARCPSAAPSVALSGAPIRVNSVETARTPTAKMKRNWPAVVGRLALTEGIA
jgi:hypothetical protein